MRGILHCSIDLRLSLLALLLASVGAILAPAPALAGNRVWTGNSPRAKSIEAITRDPLDPARAWATAFGSGVFRTTDTEAVDDVQNFHGRFARSHSTWRSTPAANDTRGAHPSISDALRTSPPV